jgi:hypothetical protein
MRHYISRQKAQSYGGFIYYQCKRGKYMLVNYHGETMWMGYVQPHGFYVVPFDHARGQSEQLKDMVA